LLKSSLVSAQVPGAADLPQLTAQVEANNFYTATPNPNDAAVMSFLHQHIQHIIYIIKENRTFDQVLGDLTNGANADPALTVFGKRITPNLHRIATNFVTLDNFFTSADVSMDGWSWSTQARVNDDIALNVQLEYASGVGAACHTTARAIIAACRPAWRPPRNVRWQCQDMRRRFIRVRRQRAWAMCFPALVTSRRATRRIPSTRGKKTATSGMPRSPRA